MYILIECCDRAIQVDNTCQTKEEAFASMEKELASAMGLKDIPEDWDKTSFKREEDFDFDEDSAWLNISDCEYDWKIAKC